LNNIKFRTGKYWSIELTILEFKQNPIVSIWRVNFNFTGQLTILQGFTFLYNSCCLTFTCCFTDTFIPFKTPLDSRYDDWVPKRYRFDINMLFESSNSNEVNWNKVNPLLHIYASYRMDEHCWSRSTSTF
jgi:hypothetical protein